jgi:hypothetical protein
MPEPTNQARLGREYLETYYPSQFSEESFGAVAASIIQYFDAGQEKLDVAELSSRYGLGPEVVENASILYHLSSVAEHIARVANGRRISVLDIGGGPTLYQHIPMALISDVIIHAEPLEENRREVSDYLAQNDGAYDWSAYIRACGIFLAKNHERFPGLSRRLAEVSDALPREGDLTLEDAWRLLIAERIAGRVVPCDVFQPDLEWAGGTALRDTLQTAGMSAEAILVESNFLLESATDSTEQWARGLDGLASRVAPGGFLSMMAIRNARWYRSGEERIPAVPVDELFLRQELERRAFTVDQVRVLVGSDSRSFGYDGMVFLLANKNVS